MDRLKLDDGDGPSRRLHFAALDHSEGKSGAYNLLYLDEDGDCDLRNNAPRQLLKDPNGLPQTYSDIDTIWFESVHVPFQFESGDRHPIALLPRLWLYKDRNPRLGFVAANVRCREFAIDGKTYKAFLGYGYAVTGRLDSTFSMCVCVARMANTRDCLERRWIVWATCGRSEVNGASSPARRRAISFSSTPTRARSASCNSRPAAAT